MKKVAILGASGFAGGELIRLLDGHPHFDPVWLIANTASGDEVSSWHSFLSGSDKRTFISIDALDLNEPDLFVLALPHGESAKIVAKLPENAKVVDLGADFRIEDKAKWEKYYSSEHAGSWTYGLPELGTNTQKVINSNKIANPGCYATAIALSLAPIIENADLDSITVVANSGTSGAGRNSSVNANIPALDIDMYGYKVGGVHQHIPEIEQSLSKLAKKPVSISFTPILIPIFRGILSVATAKISPSVTVEQVRKWYINSYQNSNFVKLLDVGAQPSTKRVNGTNNCEIQIEIDKQTNSIIVTAAIDNLVKGAAGQAIQNANLLFGYPEELGLLDIGMPI